MNIMGVIDILGALNYAFIMYMAIGIIISIVHEVPREKIKKSDANNYRKILGDNNWLFDRGGTSPADIGPYFRFFRYVVSRDAKPIIGKGLWLFYRIMVPLFVISHVWLILSLIISMVTA